MLSRFRSIVLLVVCGLVAPALRSTDRPAAVRVEICERDVPALGDRPSVAVATEHYTEEAFGLFALPQKYVATGVRADRAFPTLVRASAEVTLPPGKHRLLLRARGEARLFVDGRKVLDTPFVQPAEFAVGNAGELPVRTPESYLDLGPDFRFAPPGNRESWTELESTGAPLSVVLETLVGAMEPKSKKPFRPELGETVVAVALTGSSSWHLLSPGPRRIAYTDAGWAAYESERRARLAELDATARAARRAEHAPYWERRRIAAAAWLAATPAVPVPTLPAGFPAQNPVDHFIAERIATVAADYAPMQQSGVDYFRDVKPILEANCYSCHQGGKVKGGLRLDQRAAALRGGKSDGPALVPGRPEESPLIQRITSTDSEEVMPAKGDRLPAREIAVLRRWIAQGAPWPDLPATSFALTPLTDDLTFLRRVTLDTVGVVPTEAEIAAFRALPAATRRTATIDRLLADPRWADANMGYWLEVLAENPNLINPTLNNTGPFRWWLHESLLDNKPLDLFVTELVRQEGSERFGGPAGFSVASQNDVPMAAKGIILGSAFLGVEMKCARCHDAPTHTAKQQDLFALAAMLGAAPLKVPKTSSVVLEHLRLGGREPMIEVTLAPGTSVAPAWPFPEFCDEGSAAALAERPGDPRDRLAALITAPQNERFAAVMVNRLWQRFLGRGLVDIVGDWEKSAHSHPALLRWLARELVRSGYDQKAIVRLILTSHAYQRAADPTLVETGPLFTAPAPRHISAEQFVDSLFAATGKPFVLEPVNLDVDSVRTIDNALDLGRATRAWMLGSTSNERDRPSLMLPRLQAVAEVMEVFGWRGARPDPGLGVREVAANVLQPALLANGTMMTWLTRLSDDHGLTAFALEEQPLDTFIERLFLRLFTRPPTAKERALYREALSPGYAQRSVLAAPVPTSPAAAGALATLPASLRAAVAGATAVSFPKGKAEHCIFLWLGGGMAQIDTFDPKKRGNSKARPSVAGTDYDLIDTAVPGVQFTEHLAQTARLAEHVTAVRTVNHKLGIEHALATNFVHTGRAVSGSTIYPSLGSVIAHQRGAASDEVPAYFLIGYPSVSRGPGFLGAKHGYIYLVNTETGPAGFTPPEGIDPARAAERQRLLGPLQERVAGEAALADYTEVQREALRLAGPGFRRHFQLDQEPGALRQRYGGEFGQRCLLARRLVQAGVRFIEVSHNLNFINGAGWDTHNAGQLNQHLLIRELDTALSALIADLADKRLLDRTLIALGTEFGRPGQFDGGGGRGHQSAAFTLLLAGGGLQHRGAYGTTDALSNKPVEHPVSVPDFHATIYAALGINPAKELVSAARPVPITDGGKPIAALFA